MTIQEFIAAHGISATAVQVDHNPQIIADDWSAVARHWLVRLSTKTSRSLKGWRLSVYFSQGSAHTTAPTAADVLDCLASDASSVEQSRNFEEWASDLGYSADSRKAEKIYRTCARLGDRLEKLLGRDAYQELLYHVERL